MRKFAFLIHPRNVADVGRKFFTAKIFPDRFVEKIMEKLKGEHGFTVCSKFNVRDQVEGYIIAVLLTGKQMLTLPRHFVQERITNTVLFAQNQLGVERVGLGAYTAPFTNGGRSLVSDNRIHCHITHGDALSAVAAIMAIEEIIRIKSFHISQKTVAIVGGYGIVGRAASILISDMGPKKIILTGPNARKLEKVKKEILDNGYYKKVATSTDNIAIKEADVVILSTTSTTSIVNPPMLKNNAVVIDMAQPHNMSMEVHRARPDVLRVDGGYMSIPDIDLKFNMGPPKGATFGCLTETMISCLMGDKEDHVGLVDIQFAQKVSKKAKELGFSLAPLTNFSKPLFGTIEQKLVPKTSWIMSLARSLNLL